MFPETMTEPKDETWWQRNDRIRVAQGYARLHDPKTGVRIDRGPDVCRGSEILGGGDVAGAAEPSTWEAFDAAQFATWEFEPVEFIVDGLFPSQGLLWIGGRAKRGKSLFLLYAFYRPRPLDGREGAAGIPQGASGRACRA